MVKSCRTCLLEDDTTSFTLLGTKLNALGLGSDAVTIAQMITMCTGVMVI